MSSQRYTFFFGLVLLAPLAARADDEDRFGDLMPTAKTPQASLAAIRVRPGFQVELVAAEPLVQSPIALAWGPPDGKLWVAEMGDYPMGLDNKGKPGGRVKYLEDTDGDGRYDKATVFLDSATPCRASMTLRGYTESLVFPKFSRDEGVTIIDPPAEQQHAETLSL